MRYDNKFGRRQIVGKWALLLPICLLVTGCDDVWWKIEVGDGDKNDIDITDQIFTKRSADCDDYVGQSMRFIRSY